MNINMNEDIPLVDEEGEEVEIESLTNHNEILENLAKSHSNNLNEDHEEKAKLISRVLELQNTLEDISHRVDAVKEENLRLKSENQVLGQYIENLMAASSVFQSTFQSDNKNHKKFLS